MTNQFKPRGRGRPKPESLLQKKIINFLKVRDWSVDSTHGNAYQSGFPDLFACHHQYGSRWIEVKMPVGYAFTPAQLEQFPRWSSKNVGIYILTAATQEQYELLFKPANWHMFLSIMKEGHHG
jgi:hypothetical protein